MLVIDRKRFPRVKLCAGWVSVPIWDALEIAPASYPHGLWAWDRCHVHFGGRSFTIAARGYFIRRVELDHFLLRESGAEIAEAGVKTIKRGGGDWVINGRFRAPYLVGAGGTHCPVARALFDAKPMRPVGAQELEFQADPDQVAATRMGNDGEPELLLHRDLRGYSWNIPKTDWLNVGCGTSDAKQVRGAWGAAKAFFAERGHVPGGARAELERAKGHSYYLFHPRHLDACEHEGALLVGDALGLAQPLTAEGILPAVVSGRLAGEAIAAGDPSRYRRELTSHPLTADYNLYFQLREMGARLGRRGGQRRGPATSGVTNGTRGGPLDRAIAHSFAWMFSGRPLPGSRARGALHGLLSRRG